MPGFVGLIQLNGGTVKRELFQRMLDDLNAPQNTATDNWISPDRRVAVARRHKRIFNPETQPVRSENGASLLFLDGEIYNEEFDLDHQAQEILKGYHIGGTRFFSQLNGSFSLVIIEPEQQRVTLVVDRLATVPLYYTHKGNTFAFSSEIKPLLHLRNGDLRVDPLAVENFLASGFIFDGHTLLDEVRSLRPGEIITIENDTIHFNFYWRFHFAEQRDQRDRRELEVELTHLCKQAVQRQIRGNYSFAVPISGGYDSRSILFFCHILEPDRKLKTVTWGVNENEPESDAWVARRLSEQLSTEHIFCSLNARSLPDYFHEFIRRDEGRTDAVGNYPEGMAIFNHLREQRGIEVLIRGNELFGARNRVFRKKDILHTAFLDSLSFYPHSFHYLQPRYHRYLTEIGEAQMHRFLAETPYDDPVDRKDALFIRLRVSGYQSPLTQLKRQVIEERNPYFDNDVIDFVSRLPSHWRIWKNLFASAMREQVPDFCKTPFMKRVSLVNWDRCLTSDADLQAYISYVLFELRNGFDEIFDQMELRRFAAYAMQTPSGNRRSLIGRANRKFRERLDHYSLEVSIELFRLMILKLWVNDYLKGEFHLPV